MLILLLVFAAPLPLPKPAKPLPPMPDYVWPGRYIVRWGMNQGECVLLPDRTFWYMDGRTKRVGYYVYDYCTNVIIWHERTPSSAPGSEMKYTFIMDETRLKGKTDYGSIIHFQRWDPKRTDFIKGE